MPGLDIPGISIQAICAAVPSEHEDPAALVALHGTDKITKLRAALGISDRRISPPHQTVSDLFSACLAQLFNTRQIQPENIGILCCLTQTDNDSPGPSYRLHHHFQLPDDCLCLDIKSGCSAITTGILTCAQLLRSMSGKTAIVLAGDTLSRHVAPHDPATCLLFGDGAGAISLRHAAQGYLSGLIQTKSRGKDELALTQQAQNMRLNMDGMKVFNFSISAVPKLIETTLQQASRSIQDIDYFMLHQANAFMLATLRKKLRVPAARLPILLDRFGNTSGASIPLAFCEQFAPDHPTTVNGQFLLCGFGIGLAASTVLTRFDDVTVLPVIEV